MALPGPASSAWVEMPALGASDFTGLSSIDFQRWPSLLRPHTSAFHQMSPTFGGKANIFRMIRGFKELRSKTVKALEDIFQPVPFLSLPHRPAVITSNTVWMIMGVG